MDARCAALEQKAFLLIATQQPVASDLRLIQFVIYANFNLARMSNHVRNIAKTAKRCAGRAVPGQLIDLLASEGHLVYRVLSNCVMAIVEDDLRLAASLPRARRTGRRALQAVLPLAGHPRPRRRHGRREPRDHRLAHARAHLRQRRRGGRRGSSSCSLASAAASITCATSTTTTYRTCMPPAVPALPRRATSTNSSPSRSPRSTSGASAPCRCLGKSAGDEADEQ